MNANHVLSQYDTGNNLIYGDQIIAEIVAFTEHKVKIRDVHGKHWQVDNGLLCDVDFEDFLTDLAVAIAQSCPDGFGENSAQRVLSNMKIGNELYDFDGYLATLVEMDPHTELGPCLIFQDIYENRHQVFLYLIPNDLDFREYIQRFSQTVKVTSESPSEPTLLRYFKNEFIPKLLAQMNYDNERWGDTWLMQPQNGQEKSIHERFNEYFEFSEQFGKRIPWLRIAGHAVIAQAREDHPEWLV